MYTEPDVKFVKVVREPDGSLIWLVGLLIEI